MPPLLVASTACGVALVLRGPEGAFAAAAGTLFGLAILWILASVFLPARVERECPECGRETIGRIDGGLRGLACSECGWKDAEASAFLIAESEEGALEELVLAERSRPPVAAAARDAGGRGR